MSIRDKILPQSDLVIMMLTITALLIGDYANQYCLDSSVAYLRSLTFRSIGHLDARFYVRMIVSLGGHQDRVAHSADAMIKSPISQENCSKITLQ